MSSGKEPESRIITNESSPDAKIALFLSLFRGRPDVYPLRFENRRTGKAGYAPVCANEWVRGVCEKPRIKCADCPHRRFFAVTSEAIRFHLSGRDEHGRSFVMGVYPMLLDETCYFLAADFDKQSWQEDAGAFLETCHQLGVTAAIERSRSGNGGHVWIFFEHAIPATLARKLGAHILTETMERRPEVGFDSYDRFFPNQDTLPSARPHYRRVGCGRRSRRCSCDRARGRRSDIRRRSEQRNASVIADSAMAVTDRAIPLKNIIRHHPNCS